MRMAFDPMVEGDEDLAAETREELVAMFGRWLDGRQAYETADPWDADLVLQWKWGYADGDYGCWTRAHVDEVLLDHLPRKLSAGPQEAETIPASLGAFVRFLDDEGLLDPESDAADVVEARALALGTAFLDAMADPSKFGMAKHFFGSLGFDGDDGVPDAAAVEAAVASFNALPRAERDKIRGFGDTGQVSGLLGGAPFEPGDDLGDDDVELPVLPLRDLPSTDEIEALASDVPLLRQVDAFHEALGPEGAKLTKAGNLSLADARRMVAATGVEDRIEGVRSSTELSGLFAVGQVAMEAGASHVVGNRLAGVDGWDKLSAAERWQRVVDAAYQQGVASLAFGATLPSPLQLADFADGVAMHFLAMLWFAEEPVPVDALREVLEAGAEVDNAGLRLIHITGRDHLRSICVARRDDALRTLHAAGVIAESDGGEVSLTPAGARLSAPTLRNLGFGVVTPEEVTGLDAEGLVDVAAVRAGDVAALHALWTADRDVAGAVEDLVGALVARPEPVRVMVGFSILEHFGTAAVDVVRGALDGPVAGHAWLFLAAVGAVGHEEVPRDVVTKVAIDMFLATADDGTPADVVELVLGSVPLDEHSDFVDELATSDHERTGELLELLARHHPKPDVGRHARKAAHRWRSRQGRPMPAPAFRSLSGGRESVPTIQPRGRRPRRSGRKGRHRR